MELSQHGLVSPELGDREPDERAPEPELDQSERRGTDAARGEQSENG